MTEALWKGYTVIPKDPLSHSQPNAFIPFPSLNNVTALFQWSIFDSWSKFMVSFSQPPPDFFASVPMPSLPATVLSFLSQPPHHFLIKFQLSSCLHSLHPNHRLLFSHMFMGGTVGSDRRTLSQFLRSPPQRPLARRSHCQEFSPIPSKPTADVGLFRQ